MKTEQPPTEYSNLELQLMQAIRESFNHHIVSNSTFLAERLLAEKDNEETRLILAECYFAEAKHNMVLQLLKTCNSQACRYLYSLAAIKLNKTELAEQILKYEGNSISSYSLYMLGEAYERSGKDNEAGMMYKQAFEKNPFLWAAYEKLCKLGSVKDSSIERNVTFFKESPKRSSKENDAPLTIFQMAPDRELQRRSSSSRVEILTDSFQESRLGSKQAAINKKPISGLGLSTNKDRKENSGLILSQSSLASTQASTGTKELLGLLQSLAIPYHDMIRFNCRKAVDGFKALPSKHLKTGWTQVNIGRCHMDLGENEKAEEAFSLAFHRYEPYRVKGIEYYSSCLWQLKKQKELCELAFSVIEYNQFTPEAWIALGNCFSLQRDHEGALNFFHRAIQLDPRFSYAHCLKGHEYIYSDQFVKAKNCYDLALKYDQNNFQAWWGLGNVSLKQEKYDRALEYLKRASALNSKNSVIHSYIGIVYEKMEKNTEALAAFKMSEELNPKVLMNRFHKTQIYYKIGDYANALVELESLINLSPKESQLYIMVGNVYKRLGHNQKALQYYMSAQDLENKESQRVKNLIDALTHSNNQLSNYENEFN